MGQTRFRPPIPIVDLDEIMVRAIILRHRLFKWFSATTPQHANRPCFSGARTRESPAMEFCLTVMEGKQEDGNAFLKY
jgi:hypothetical protein